MRYRYLALLGLLAALVPRPAAAEQCPPTEPTWLGGRVVVWEPNLNPAQFRGMGEVFVYAFTPGDSQPDTRFMARPPSPPNSLSPKAATCGVFWIVHFSGSQAPA